MRFTLRTKINDSGCDRPVRNGRALTELSLAKLYCGKAKTGAVAAFLGESATWREKTPRCCSIVTKRALKRHFR
jgi:hypothetical protein